MNVLQTPPVPAGAQVCSSCGAPLSPDQRYCLACGQPVSPARLAFLDVLQAEEPYRYGEGGWPAPAGHLTGAEEGGAGGWLRRNSGLLSLLTVLLVATLIGLEIGHWVTQSSAPAHQILTIQDPSLSAAASGASGDSSAGESSAGSASPAAAAPSSGASHSSSGHATGQSAKQSAKASSAAGQSSKSSEAQEVQEVKEAETQALPKAVKADSGTLKKLQGKTGKSYQKELSKLVNGTQPIEG